jgi:hypothetical protein
MESAGVSLVEKTELLWFARNRLVRQFLEKPAGSPGFYRFDCMDGLLSEPDQ